MIFRLELQVDTSRYYAKTVFQMEQVWRDGNEEHKVEYHKEHMGRNEE